MSYEIDIVDSPVVIPASFVGACCASIPVIPPSVNYHTTRSWDYSAGFGVGATCVATFINPSSGVFSWATFDSLISNNLNKQIVFVLGATPDYLVSRAAIGGSYKGTKGNMCPDDLTGWATLVTALVNRAKNTFGKTGIIWQVFNEMNETASYADSPSLLGPYTRVTAQAIKAADPSAKVISPPVSGTFQSALTYAQNYLLTSDGAGGICADWIDGVAFHHYIQTFSSSSANESCLHYYNAYAAFYGMLKGIGKQRLPIYITETGVLALNPIRAKVLQRRAVVFAAAGAKLCMFYCYDSTTYTFEAFPDEINFISNLLTSGKTISSCKIGYGPVTCVIDGIEYVV